MNNKTNNFCAHFFKISLFFGLWMSVAQLPAYGSSYLLGLEIAQQTSSVEGGVLATGFRSQLALDWVALKPSRSVFLLVGPIATIANVKGDIEGEKFALLQQSYGLSLGLLVRINPKLRLQGRISGSKSLSGDVEIGEEKREIGQFSDVSHNWMLVIPYSKKYRVGISASWMQSQFAVRDDPDKVNYHSVAYGLYNSWRF